MKRAFVGTGVAFLYLVLGYGYWIAIESKTLGRSVAGSPRADTGAVGEISRELDRFRGTWRLISSVTNGQEVPRDELDGVLVRFDGDHQTVMLGGRVVAHCMKFTIDPTTEPKRTDDSIDRGPFRGRKIRGIYTLEGDGLIACVGPIDGERPTGLSREVEVGGLYGNFGECGLVTLVVK